MSFNPLHCGAVVASFVTGSLSSCARLWVSIPFIAGQWSLLFALALHLGRFLGGFNPLHCGAVVASMRARRHGRPHRRVSIPFIAGQWSLPVGCIGRVTNNVTCFNPLHCGAVVASTLVGALRRALPACFNPLHCGAVVASLYRVRHWQMT